MSVYKESKDELKSSIESILNQTYKEIEIIIVVDNPEEQWRIDYIKNLKDKRIKLLVNSKNIGLPKSLNKALCNANGEYIARMDADDIAMPFRLEKQLKFLKETGYDMCGSNVTCFIEKNNFKDIKFPQKASNVKKMLFIKNCVSHPTYFAKKEVYQKLNGYNNIFSCEDYDFLLRAVKKEILIGNVQEILLRYRISPQSISRKNAGRQELIAKYLRNYYKKNNNVCVTEKMIEEYTNSKRFKSQLQDYDFYWGMKNTRSKYKERKGIRYYIYTILLILNLRHSLKEIYIKIYEKWIFFIESKGKK